MLKIEDQSCFKFVLHDWQVKNQKQTLAPSMAHLPLIYCAGNYIILDIPGMEMVKDATNGQLLLSCAQQRMHQQIFNMTY